MPGITTKDFSETGFAALFREFLASPPASSANTYSSTSDGGSSAAFSIASSVANDTVYLSAKGKGPILIGRRLLLTMTDNSGSDLTLSIRVNGYRHGRAITEVITWAAGDTTKNSTRIYDELTSVKIISIANNGASDTLGIGPDDQWLGLSKPIRNYQDVKLLAQIDYNSAAGSISEPCKYGADITSAMVNVTDAAIDVKTLFQAVAPRYHYMVEYVSRGDPESFLPFGRRFG